MDGSVLQTWMSDILHAITQGLLVPDIVLLIAFIAYALFCIGSIIVEVFTERRHFKVTMPKFLAALMSADEKEIPQVIEESGLLKRQKIALLTVYDYRVLPGDALIALIKRLMNEEEARYDRISGRNNMAARVSPMLGLMGTLIPLGPGIQALGSANTELLSASLLIAFDTTVAGLVVAAVCMVVGKIRSVWYSNYMSALDGGMATLFQKIEDMRAEGKIVTQEPSDYAFLFEQALADKTQAAKAKPAPAESGSKPATPKSDAGKANAGAKASANATSTSTSRTSSVGEQVASAAAQMPVTGAVDATSTTSTMGATSATSVAGVAGTTGALDAIASAAAVPASTYGQVDVVPATSQFDPASPSVSGNDSAYANSSDGTLAQTAYAYGNDAASVTGFPSYDANGVASGAANIADNTTANAGFDYGTGSIPAQGAAPLYGADVSGTPTTSYVYEPLQPLQADASFAPVPDPAFISDLAAAAAADTAASYGQQADVSSAPVYEPPAEPVKARPSGWYQPQLRSDAEASQPYIPADPYSQQAQYPYPGMGQDNGTTR